MPSEARAAARGAGRNKDEDLTGWLTCKDAVKFEKIGSCLTCGKLSLAFNGIGDKEAIALAKGQCPWPRPQSGDSIMQGALPRRR